MDQLGLEGHEPPSLSAIPDFGYFTKNSKLPHHTHALYNCALTCKSWLFCGRVNLYRNVHIVDGHALAALRWTLETQSHF